LLQEWGGNGSNNSYNADSIKVSWAHGGVAQASGDVTSDDGRTSLHHLVYEVVDNSVDEALAGFATKIEVTIHLDNSITVIETAAVFRSTIW